MSKRRIHVRWLLSDETAREVEETFLEATFNGENAFSRSVSSRGIDTFDRLYVNAHIRLNVPEDAPGVKTALVNRMNQRPQILAGSVVALHTCLHDEAEENWVPCMEDDVVVK